MLRQEYSCERERIIANAIAPLAAELRLVNVEYFVAFTVLERYAFIADIVKSSAELWFAPGFIELGHGGDVRLDWDTLPSVTLDLVMRPAGLTAYLSLKLTSASADIVLNYIRFNQPSECAGKNTAFLLQAIETNSIA